MSDILNGDIIDFDNDASASSFGWNFQSNAGLFLFLHYIDVAENLKIESKLQDVEISLNDGGKILAQAKSSQDPSLDKGKKEKFKDALISIAKSTKKEPKAKLIYISNESDTFTSASKSFDNRVRAYKECLDSIKKEIDETINSVETSIQMKLNKYSGIKDEDLSSKDKKDKNKYSKILKLIKALDKNNLFFSCITEFWGDEDNRYYEIKRKIEDFLSLKLGLPSSKVVKISGRLFEHWQHECNHNSTLLDEKKEMTKAEFVWPVSVYLLEDLDQEIEECLSFALDASLEEECNEIFKSASFIYHERFEFSNKVIQDFILFRNQFVKTDNSTTLEKEFLKQKGCDYCDEFKQENFNSEKLEYITKLFVYRIVCNWRNLNGICPKVGLKI